MSDEKKMVKEDYHIKKHRAMVFLASVLAVLFLSVSSILAYEYYLEKIERCSVSDGGICFDLEEVGIQDKATIKNLQDDKKYRIVIKKKLSDEKSIEIGSVEVNTSEEEKAALRIGCTDTDGGENYYIKGTASSPYDSAEQQDSCDGSQLVEGICKPGSDGQPHVAKLNYTCPTGCENGACKTEADIACFDTDGGKDFYVFGETRQADLVSKDECVENNMLVESICENGIPFKAEVICPSGCENGVCKIGFLGERCIDDNGCTMGLECKRSGRYPGDINDPSVYSERFCCVSDNCASVIPGPGIIDFNTAVAPHCVATGGTDTAMDGTTLTCNNGSY